MLRLSSLIAICVSLALTSCSGSKEEPASKPPDVKLNDPVRPVVDEDELKKAEEAEQKRIKAAQKVREKEEAVERERLAKIAAEEAAERQKRAAKAWVLLTEQERLTATAIDKKLREGVRTPLFNHETAFILEHWEPLFDTSDNRKTLVKMTLDRWLAAYCDAVGMNDQTKREQLALRHWHIDGLSELSIRQVTAKIKQGGIASLDDTHKTLIRRHPELADLLFK